MSDYESLDDAIYAAAEATRAATGDKKEAMTGIYRRPDGKYAFGLPATEGKRSSFSGSVKFPKGSVLAALVHNHPGASVADEGQSKFSQEDIDIATQLGLPSIITFGSDMAISRYTPGVDNVLRGKANSQARSARYSIGTPFDYIPEVRVTAQKMGLLESLQK